MFGFPSRWHFPKQEGPYVPGVFDITTEATSDHDALLVRLFYPTDLPPDQDHSSGWIKWSPPTKYIEGMAFTGRIWTWLLKLFFWIFAARAMVPAVWAAIPLKRKMPVIVISHGLGGYRNIYTATCVQLASHGFLVACIEHGDRSACMTYRKLPREQWIHFQHLPANTKEYAPLREAQIAHRVKDSLSTLHLLDKLNAGSIETQIRFTDCLDFDSLTMMGHSFGAATSLAVLGQESRFKLGIILDAWMYPLNKDKATLPDSIRQPLIFINTETFHIDKNVTALRLYIKQHPVYTMRRTTHEYQTDTVHIFGSWLNFFMRNKMTAVDATRINNYLILRWLQQHTHKQLPFDQTFLDSQSANIIEDLIVWKKQ